jgi:hypothetical protein
MMARVPSEITQGPVERQFATIEMPKTALEIIIGQPASIGFATYRRSHFALFAIDRFRAAKPSRYPLSVATPATDFPLALSSELAPLDELHEHLRQERPANGLKRACIQLSSALPVTLARMFVPFTRMTTEMTLLASRHTERSRG